MSSYRDVHAIDPAGGTRHVLTAESGALAWHAARYDTGRALAEVDAKRRILDVIGECCEHGPDDYCAADRTVQLLALPYADRPGYRDEWRP